jgi:hypothetical protein
VDQVVQEGGPQQDLAGPRLNGEMRYNEPTTGSHIKGWGLESRRERRAGVGMAQKSAAISAALVNLDDRVTL